jgi:hypothetical protein
MQRILMLPAGALLLFLMASCASSPRPIQTEIVEVPVEVRVPLPRALTEDVAPPARPSLNCTDPKLGLPTLCTYQLPDWINALEAWGNGYRSRMGEVRELQPKADPPPLD